ncbi:MAG: CopL family metal-binding regulatory protein [Lysobacter sp.]
MPRFALLLRCLIVLAFCLDGSAMAWQSSAMAIASVQHAHSHVANAPHADAGHGMDSEEAVAIDCGEASEDDHSESEECACSDGGCDCACGFVTLALGRGVPPLDAMWVGFLQVSPDLTTIRPVASSSVFRPPIG